MLTKILIYLVIAISIISGTLLTIQYIKIAKLEVNIVEKDNAISAYEELLKVIPFNRMVEERIENVESEINATLSDTNSIASGIYRM